MFQIVVDGSYRLVEFSEPGILGASTFRTTDERVISAIKRHKFFRQGKIWMDDDGCDPVKTSQEEEKRKKEKEEEVQDFKSYSHLKSYLKRTFKDDPGVKKIKTPEDVTRYAKQKGMSFRFVDG